MAGRKTDGRRTRGGSKTARRCRWCIAPVVAVSLAVVVSLFHGGDHGALDAMNESDTRALFIALRSAKEETHTHTIDEVVGHMTRVGVALEKTLVEAEGKAATVAREKAVADAIETYRAAAVFLLERLQPVLQKDVGNVSLRSHYEKPELLWRWIAVASYAFTSVLPEYYLAMDDTHAHGEALVIGLHLLLQASNARFLTHSVKEPLVDCTRNGEMSRWEHFCRKSFEHLHGLETRRAAIFEELIALHPDYAPLRLHYVVALSLSRHAVNADVVFERIQNERRMLPSRTHVDPLYRAVLQLCEVFISHGRATTHSKDVRQTVTAAVVEGLREIGTCTQLLRPFHADVDSWGRRFRGQTRPDVMDQRQAGRLLGAVRELLQSGGNMAMFPPGFAECGVIE